MKKFINFVESLSKFISGDFAGILVFIMMCMIMVEVVTRYVLHFPLTISDELGGYMLVAVTFIGLAFTWKEKGHVRITFIVSRLPDKLQKWLRLISLIIGLILAATLLFASYEFTSYSYSMGIKSFGLRIPMVWPQLALGIGSLILLLQLIVELIKVIHGNNPTESEPE